MTFALLLSLLLQAPPPKETVTIPGTKVSFDLVRLPGDGTLRPFSIGAKEVTWAEFSAYSLTKAKGVDAVTRPSQMQSWLGEFIPREALADRRPAALLRWHSAVGYCEWLSKKTGRYFRLPTEREWEYAARAGEKGEQAGSLDERAWHQGNSNRANHLGGEKKPNAFGLYDMLGNVWEYCLDFEAAPEFRPVLRGGSYRSPAGEIGWSSRRTVPDEWFRDDPVRPRSTWWLVCEWPEQGFRVVCDPGDADPEERGAAAKIDVTILGSEEVRLKTETASPEFFVRVKARVKNGSSRSLDELQLRVFFRNAEGSPHLMDVNTSNPSRATFTLCWPVLAAGARPTPLKAGESRDFEVFVPQSFEPELKDSFGAEVMTLRFSKE
jgi:hypothetical protein